MCQTHDESINCILPPHMIDSIRMRGDAKLRKMAEEMIKLAERNRESREESAPPTAFMAAELVHSASDATLEREVFDGEKKAGLPGKSLRNEGDAPSGDTEGDEAYEGAGATYKLYLEEFKRNSIDGAGMIIRSTVHHRRRYNNAFWNGSQMVYGDGDGALFNPLTSSLSVVAHELSHGVVQFSGGLVYQDQSGALNESFADVFGCLTEQYARGENVSEASWLVGAEVLGPGVKGDALRSMKAPGLAYDDTILGKDPQPFHMDGFVSTSSDRGGVHINSGIPNHAFYLLAQLLGGNSWEKAGHIWYDSLQSISNPMATFSDWATETIESARTGFGSGSREQLLTRRAWKLVGVDV